MRLLGWFLMQYDWYPIKMGKFEQNTHKIKENSIPIHPHRTAWEHEGRDQGDASGSQGMPACHQI